MEMFLMVLALSFVGALVCSVLFAVATREARQPAAGGLAGAAASERFFVMRPAAPQVGRVPVSADVLARRIERHVRFEQVAAEYFSQFPSAEALHGRTLTPMAG